MENFLKPRVKTFFVPNENSESNFLIRMEDVMELHSEDYEVMPAIKLADPSGELVYGVMVSADRFRDVPSRSLQRLKENLGLAELKVTTLQESFPMNRDMDKAQARILTKTGVFWQDCEQNTAKDAMYGIVSDLQAAIHEANGKGPFAMETVVYTDGNKVFFRCVYLGEGYERCQWQEAIHGNMSALGYNVVFIPVWLNKF